MADFFNKIGQKRTFGFNLFQRRAGIREGLFLARLHRLEIIAIEYQNFKASPNSARVV